MVTKRIVQSVDPSLCELSKHFPDDFMGSIILKEGQLVNFGQED